MKTAFALFAVATAASAAGADVIGVALGTSRVDHLGSFDMTLFGEDPQGGFTGVTGVASPLGGHVTFTPTLAACDVGTDWATWSGAYTGTVYWTQGATSTVLTLPEQTGAFIFYAEPNPFDTYSVRVMTNDGTELLQEIDGSAGASGYGFYTTDGDSISSIGISADVDFAIGEFSIAAVPAPATAGLLGLGALVAVRRRR